MQMLACQTCGEGTQGPRERVADPWTCRCGGRLEVRHEPDLPRTHPREGGSFGAWRSALPLPVPEGLSVGGTPLVLEDTWIHVKAEYRNPTGSFKDRGAAVVVAAALADGVGRLAADSSGNAALALAAQAGREGLDCRLFVPEALPASRRARLESHGATVTLVEGPRSAVARACREHLATGEAGDAGHARNPWFLWGTRTFAWEAGAQMKENPPRDVVLPVGNGTLLLGAWLGFRDLADAGRIHAPPRMHAVQVAGGAPLGELAGRGAEATDTQLLGDAGREARGLMVDEPPLGTAVLAAVEESGGSLILVGEEEIRAALADLAGRGHPPDPCNGVTWAGVRRLDASSEGALLTALSGSGCSSRVAPGAEHPLQ